MSNVRYWIGPDLGGFDDFGNPYGKVMYDAATKNGLWANMSEKSFKLHGRGKLGTGFGIWFISNSC
jgi:hypothetical protein